MRVSRRLILLTVASGVCACDSIESEIHLIPRDYVGPVFIYFDEPATVVAEVDTTRIYQVPTDGFLCVDAPPTISASPQRKFYYRSESGERREIPFNASENAIQVHSLARAEIAELDGVQMSRYQLRYIVGLPTGDGWTGQNFALMLDATRRAVTECPLSGE